MMSQALPADHSGHITRVARRVAYYCVMSGAYPDSHMKMKMYIDEQRNKEGYRQFF